MGSEKILLLFLLPVVIVEAEKTFQTKQYKYVEASSKKIKEESEVCKMDKMKFCQLCEKAIKETCDDQKFVYVGPDEIPLEGMKTYRLANQIFGNQTYVSACNCPTSPLIFMKDGASENEVTVIKIEKSSVSYRYYHMIERKEYNTGSYGSRGGYGGGSYSSHATWTPGPLDAITISMGGGIGGLFR